MIHEEVEGWPRVTVLRLRLNQVDGILIYRYNLFRQVDGVLGVRNRRLTETTTMIVCFSAVYPPPSLYSVSRSLVHAIFVRSR